MTLNEYCKKYNYSKAKAKKSLEYVKGIRKCPNCKCIEIPDDAETYYVPDNRIVKDNEYRKYFYVLEAIIKRQIIIKELTGLDIDECKTIVKELQNIEYISLIVGRSKESLDYNDYIVSKKGLDWKNADVQKRKEVIYNIFEILKNISKIKLINK